MNKCECYAAIAEQDPRAVVWRQVVGPELRVPLKHPLPVRMNGPHGEMVFYHGDPSRLTKKQWQQLADAMAGRFHISRESVIEDLRNGIIPIKAEGCVVSICQRHALCMM